MSSTPFKVAIVGCGLGGLACAIACRKEGLDVVILERAPEIGEVGAGIQLPPNAMRVMRHLGLYERIMQAGAVEMDRIQLRNFVDGEILCTNGDLKTGLKFGEPWCVIHRADYHSMLLNEAVRLGAKIQLDCEVQKVDFGNKPKLTLKTGQTVVADIVIGADGLWSGVREQILGYPCPPESTGDLAYRATVSADELAALNSARINSLLQNSEANVWLGPQKHCVFYPVRNGTQYNLVLLRPDNLPPNMRTGKGDIQEMRDTFKGWDPVLTTIISRIPSVLKWKLCHHPELEVWVKDSVALLGDACHPTLPYQAQGAAMAVEDGATLGLLLGSLFKDTRLPATIRHEKIPSVLKLYERIRKSRTTLNVKGAIQNQTLYHMEDEQQRILRNQALKAVNWKDPCVWNFGDIGYQTNLLGFDTFGVAKASYNTWAEEEVQSLKQQCRSRL